MATSPEDPQSSAGRAGSQSSPPARFTATGFQAVPGSSLRRSKTVGETSPHLRRPYMNNVASDTLFDSPPRRSSNFSDYSFNEARDLLNPKPTNGQFTSAESSSLASLSLAFALLPALAGALFKNGSAVVTDILLLSLAAVFLNWSVTQPWSWYHSAQQMRIRSESETDVAVEEGSDIEALENSQSASTVMDDIPEEKSTESGGIEASQRPALTPQKQSALNELYAHEIIALASCLLLPLAGAYLLHAIRSQLSRPSEGLVSNYNLTIFLLVSELRVFSHILKLVQSRTLYLQRVVHGNPFTAPSDEETRINEVLSRVEKLEARSAAEEMLLQKSLTHDSTRAKQDAILARDVRNTIQPELDALNRAVRRYEKKATLLQFQTESRFSVVDARLDDAIALAAIAAKNTASQKNIFLRFFESAFNIVLFPINTVLHILLLPLSTLLAALSRKNKVAPQNRGFRSNRPGKAPLQPRYNGDRVPARLAKR